MFQTRISDLEITSLFSSDNSDFSLPYKVKYPLYSALYIPLSIKPAQASLSLNIPDFSFPVIVSEGEIRLSSEFEVELPNSFIQNAEFLSKDNFETRDGGWNYFPQPSDKKDFVSIYRNDEGIVVDVYQDDDCVGTTYAMYEELIGYSNELTAVAKEESKEVISDYELGILINHDQDSRTTLATVGGINVVLSGGMELSDEQCEYPSNAEMKRLLKEDPEFLKWLQGEHFDKYDEWACASNPWLTCSFAETDTSIDDCVFDELPLNPTTLAILVSQYYA